MLHAFYLLCFIRKLVNLKSKQQPEQAKPAAVAASTDATAEVMNAWYAKSVILHIKYSVFKPVTTEFQMNELQLNERLNPIKSKFDEWHEFFMSYLSR